MKIFDAHTHLNDVPFHGHEQDYVDNANELAVVKIANVGSNRDFNERAIKLSEQFTNMYAIVGFHPDDSKLYNEAERAILAEQLPQAKVVAVGEIGLDYHWDASPRAIQREAFRDQLELAHELKLPVNVHTRDAMSDTYDILKDSNVRGFGGVIHNFNGDPEWLQKFLDLGLYVSFSGVVTFKNAKEVHESARLVPLDRVLVETDAPYLTPMPYRGKQNEPAYTRYVVEKIAALKELPIEEVAAATYQNTMELYGIK